MKKRIYIEIPGQCKRVCVNCPSVHSAQPVNVAFYCNLLDDAKEEGFNWVGFCGVNPIEQPHFLDVLNHSLRIGMKTRVYGSDNIEILKRIPSSLLSNLQYTIILTEEMLIGDMQELLGRLVLIKKRFNEIMIAVKIVARDDNETFANKIRDIGFPVFLTQWWFMFRGDTYGYAVSIPKLCPTSQPTSERDPDTLICKASIDKIFVDQNMNLKACYMAKKYVANLYHAKLGECMQSDVIWGAWRTIRLKDMKRCHTCNNRSICHICPATLIETGKHTTCMSERLE